MAPPFLGLVLAGLASVPLSGEDLLIEAESFADTGGWVLDTQSVASMGSPYLLAHGLGIPLADARTTIVFPQAGSYRLWIRTRDWVPDHPDAPGRFQVLLDGEPVPVEFGTVAGDWNWQDGGMVTVAAGSVEIALRDLTGFDGRCDALAFLSDPDTPPPNEPVALEAWRRQMLGESSEPPVVDSYDLVVVGGGLAGCCAAIAAAREGLTVALIQDRPFLGGNASQEIRVPTQGMVRHPIVESVRNSGPHRDPVMIEHDAHRLAVVTAETNITVFLNWRAFAANTDEEGRIFSVDARQTGTGETRRFPASWFVDSTGDGWIGYWAGADFRMGREARDEFEESRAPLVADAQTMGSSIMWNAVDTGSPASFPAVPWAMAVAGSADAVEGGWNWEYGLLLDTIYDAEAIRDHLLRAIYGNFANARKRSQYANYALAWVPYVTGKRESRRLLGDHILTENDVREGVFFEDAVGMGSWPIDVHEPTAVDYRSVALNTAVAPYFFPFRSLYSRNVPNLMMAGRCLSATHVGLGSPRVMHTCGQMGVAVGYAASLCQRYGVDPREIYRDPDKTLELQLLIGGDWPDRPPPLVAIVDNVAGTGQRVVVTGDWTSSTSVSGFHGTDYLHDGNTDKGGKSVQFVAQLPESGRYTVYLRWTAGENRASNVPVTLSHGTTIGEPEVTSLPAIAARSIRNSTPDTVLDPDRLPLGRIAPSDYHRGLLEFDLSTIPDNAHIVSASLDMVIKERDAGSSSFIGADGMRVYRVTEAAQLDAATWNRREPEVPWTNAGGTFDPTPLSMIPEPTDPDAVVAGEVFPFPGSYAFAEAVQLQLGSDRLWLLIRTPTIESDYNARKLYWFAGAEDPEESARPVLTVAWTTNQTGIRQSFTVDQREDGGRWMPLGTFEFAAEEAVAITLSNAGTDGHVIADAVAFGLADARPLTDRDDDGLPDWWERWHFLDEVAARPDADPDGDHVTNLGEFRCGTLPLDDQSVLRIRDLLSGVGSGWVLRWASEADRTYSIETAGRVEGPYELLATGIPATPPTNSYQTEPGVEPLFYRVAVEQSD